MRILVAIMLVLALVTPGPASAQCTCNSEIDSLATELAQLQSDLYTTKLRLQLLKQHVGSNSQQFVELRERIWPVFYRGGENIEDLLSWVEKERSGIASK